MTWDSVKMADRFLRQANALYPEEARSEGRYEEDLARQDLYYECYMNAFSKDKVVKFLNDSISGNIKCPDEVDEERYKSAFAAEARQVLKQIN